MTQEEKQLLLKDICARLPYGVKVWYPNGSGAISTVKGIVGDVCYFNEEPSHGNFCHIERVKPYLRPMSSMTENEQRTLDSMCNGVEMVSRLSGLKMFDKAFDWLNANHFNYRLPPHLFFEVTEENNPYK